MIFYLLIYVIIGICFNLTVSASADVEQDWVDHLVRIFLYPFIAIEAIGEMFTKK